MHRPAFEKLYAAIRVARESLPDDMDACLTSAVELAEQAERRCLGTPSLASSAEARELLQGASDQLRDLEGNSDAQDAAIVELHRAMTEALIAVSSAPASELVVQQVREPVK